MRHAPRRSARDVHTAKPDAAARWAQLAGKKIHESGLARSIRPNDRMKLVGAQAERDIPHRMKAAEGFRKSLSRQDGLPSARVNHRSSPRWRDRPRRGGAARAANAERERP